MKWIQMLLKQKDKVFVPVDDRFEPVRHGALVPCVYKLSPTAKVYRANRANLAPIDGAHPVECDFGPDAPDAPRFAGAKPGAAEKTAAQKTAWRQVATRDDADAGNGGEPKTYVPPEKLPRRGKDAAPLPEGAIVAYTDGGASPNPGPGGLGVLIDCDGQKTELWEYFPHTTNNVLELTAILRAVERVPDKKRPVVVFSDSNYAIGVITGAMKARANQELLAQIHAATAECPDLELRKVRAHAGDASNEHVDKLCHRARNTRQSGERRL